MALSDTLAIGFFIIIAGWMIARAIEHAAGTSTQALGNKLGPSADANAQRVAQIAATLIGAAMNNPQYIARMEEIKGNIKHLWDIKPACTKGIFEPPEERDKIEHERKQIEEHIHNLEHQARVTDLFHSGHQPYIDLAFEIYREVHELQRKETTFYALDSERAMNAKDPEAAEAIVRNQRIREFARP